MKFAAECLDSIGHKRLLDVLRGGSVRAMAYIGSRPQTGFFPAYVCGASEGSLWVSLGPFPITVIGPVEVVIFDNSTPAIELGSAFIPQFDQGARLLASLTWQP